jgi:enamine deaminase RidA (YjgF/YER057c/UK114 family)
MRYILKAESVDRRGARRKLYCIIAGSAVSGQGGWDDNLQITESLADEIAQAFRNVERTLATAGAGWEHVVHVNSYHVGGFPRRLTK